MIMEIGDFTEYSKYVLVRWVKNIDMIWELNKSCHNSKIVEDKYSDNIRVKSLSYVKKMFTIEIGIKIDHSLSDMNWEFNYGNIMELRIG